MRVVTYMTLVGLFGSRSFFHKYFWYLKCSGLNWCLVLGHQDVSRHHLPPLPEPDEEMLQFAVPVLTLSKHSIQIFPPGVLEEASNTILHDPSLYTVLHRTKYPPPGLFLTASK